MSEKVMTDKQFYKAMDKVSEAFSFFPHSDDLAFFRYWVKVQNTFIEYMKNEGIKVKPTPEKPVKVKRKDILYWSVNIFEGVEVDG